MDRIEIKKKFPIDFPENILPLDAKEQCIQVYRVCRSGKIEPLSFMPTYKDFLFKIRDANELEKQTCGFYSLSTYEKIKDAKKRLKLFKRSTPAAITAVGITVPECGPCQRTKDRIGESPKTSHVDWWLYEGANPHIHFREVEE